MPKVSAKEQKRLDNINRLIKSGWTTEQANNYYPKPVRKTKVVA